MADRPDDAPSRVAHKPLDWHEDVYVDRFGTQHFIEKGIRIAEQCEKDNGGVSQFPKADEVLKLSSCVQQKRTEWEARVNDMEAQNAALRLPEKLKEAAHNGKKEAVVMNFDTPHIPEHFNELIKKLNDNGYKTGLVHTLTGEPVQEGKRVPGHQLYSLVAKFEK